MANLKLTRAETLTGAKKKTEFFSDFVSSFVVTPMGNQLGRVTNEKAVNQSLKNILLTDLGERLFQPNIGSDISYMLFEPNLIENYEMIETFIRATVKNWEPRAQIQKVFFSDIEGQLTSESQYSAKTIQNIKEEHDLYVTIIYNLINNPEPITFNLILKRVR